MKVQTSTWTAAGGWSPALPLPDAHNSCEPCNTLVFVFGDADVAHHVHDPIGDVAAAWGAFAVLGCSTAGQLHTNLPDGVVRLDDDALVVSVVRFEQTTLRHAHVEVAPSGSDRRAGRRLAEQLADKDLAGIFVLSDGLTVNGTSLAAGLTEMLPNVSISGGLAGDGSRFQSTWTVVHGEAREGWVSAVGFVGDHLDLGYGSADGWDLFGPERLVTRSYGNVVYELDEKPALDLYRDYLGDRAADLPATASLLPMSVRDLDDNVVVRNVLHIDDANRSLGFAGDVPQGSVAQLMSASLDSLIHGAHLAAKDASLGDDELVIAISCSGRRMVLGSRTEEELEAVQQAVSPGAALIGFYSYGELSPTDGECEIQNQSMTVTTLRERR